MKQLDKLFLYGGTGLVPGTKGGKRNTAHNAQ